MSVVYIHSHDGPLPTPFVSFADQQRVIIMRDDALNDAVITGASGLITTMHLDQLRFAGLRPALAVFLASGGRLFFNGHILKPFIEGLDIYRPLDSRKLADFQLRRLVPHPVFGPLDPKDMVARRGVAGFYGRGHNPMPEGAVALTGLGPEQYPIDWEWALPGGGMIFSHAGNDLWSLSPEASGEQEPLADRVLRWTAGAFEGVNQ